MRGHALLRDVFHQFYVRLEPLFRPHGISLNQDFHSSAFSPWTGEVRVISKHRNPKEGDDSFLSVVNLFKELFDKDPEIVNHIARIQVTKRFTHTRPFKGEAASNYKETINLLPYVLDLPEPFADSYSVSQEQGCSDPVSPRGSCNLDTTLIVKIKALGEQIEY